MALATGLALPARGQSPSISQTVGIADAANPTKAAYTITVTGASGPIVLTDVLPPGTVCEGCPSNCLADSVLVAPNAGPETTVTCTFSTPPTGFRLLSSFPTVTNRNLVAFVPTTGVPESMSSNASTVLVSSVSGDADGSGAVNVSDVFFLINYLFAGGPPPHGLADVNGDGMLTVTDVFYLINYLFAGGPAPQSAASTGFAATIGGAPAQLTSADALSIGRVTTQTRTGTVRVPVSVKDNTGTVLGRDRPGGQKISTLVFQVTYGAVIPCITSVSFDRQSGILAGLTATNERQQDGGSSSAGYAVQIAESNGLIPFGGGWNHVGDFVFTLDACPAATIPLVVTTTPPWLAMLSCDQCPPNAAEHTLNGGLAVTNGSLVVK